MAKKATTPALEAPESSEEVVISTAPETEGTEATTSAAIDQPAVSDDASASSPSPSAPEAPSFPAEEMQPGGGFSSPFAEPPAALTMVQRIEILEAKVAALEAVAG